MKVIINEKEHEYLSDYPNGWSFIAKDYFKFPVQIGKHKCFIKRFETTRINNIPGWDLMMKLRWKNEPNLPRVYDIVTVEENRRQIHYVFQEYLKGSTLEGLVKSEVQIDLRQLTEDVINGLQSIHRQDYWFADFCEKNIFCTDTGRFYLIDLDSCVPASEPLTNDMPVSMVYWALIFKFYREVVQLRDLRLSDIPAVKLNYLQLIFLVLHLHLFSLHDREDYMSDSVFNELPASLDKVDAAFAVLFRKLVDKPEEQDFEKISRETRSLIKDKIIPLSEWPPPPADEDVDDGNSEGQAILAPAHLNKVPEIISFTSSTVTINAGESYTLSWDVQRAKEVQLFKNGKPFYKPGARTKSMAISEPAGTTESELKFQLGASNEAGEVKTEPLVIKVLNSLKRTDTVSLDPPKPGNTFENEKQVTKGKHRGVIAVTAVLLLIVLVVVFKQAKRDPVHVSGFTPSLVYEGNPVIISGENFPEKRNAAEVYFGNTPGNIQYISERLITVVVPRISTVKVGRRQKLKVLVVCDGDTAYAEKELTVMRKLGD